ncbi:hypothetical protein Taro_027735, partial [Colocasia esculenta]|nr:hypothetical protein [Colocasia esculenta]
FDKRRVHRPPPLRRVRTHRTHGSSLPARALLWSPPPPRSSRPRKGTCPCRIRSKELPQRRPPSPPSPTAFMSQNPFEALLRSFESVARSVQAHVSRLFPADPQEQRSRHPKRRSESSSSVPPPAVISMPSTTAAEMEDLFPLRPKEDFSESGPRPKEKSSGAVSKEELGRATWTLLHMIAAKFPERPTRQQRRDAKELMAIISRLYPCKECADHFKEILRQVTLIVYISEEFRTCIYSVS